MSKLHSDTPVTAEGGPVNVAVQRPTVNLKEAENVGEQATAEAARFAAPRIVFSKHGMKYGRTTHDGLE
jgi:hypothetical protein